MDPMPAAGFLRFAGWMAYLAAALPVLGWSRVALGRHRWAEVVVGLLVGAGTGALLVRLV